MGPTGSTDGLEHEEMSQKTHHSQDIEAIENRTETKHMVVIAINSTTTTKMGTILETLHGTIAWVTI